MSEHWTAARDVWRRAGPRLVTVAAVSLSVIITVLYALQIPVGSGPDEREHILYVDVIARHWRLPLMPDAATPETSYLQAEQAQHPPLYYLVLAVLRAATLPILSEDRSAVVLRLASVLLALGAFAAVWASARTLWPNAPWRAAFAVSFLALLPATQYMTSLVNNSVGAMLLTSLAVLACCRLLRREETGWKDWLWVGLATAAALCTKMTSTWVVGLVLVCAIHKTRAENTSLRQKLTNWLAIGIPVVVLLGPWLMRNELLYGTPLPERITSRRLEAGNLFTLIFYPEYTYIVTTGIVPEILLGVLCPYWLLRLYYPRAVVAPAIPLLYLLPGVGAAISLGRRVRCRRERPFGPRDACLVGLGAALILQAGMLVYMSARDYNVMPFVGRYAWEAVGAVAILWTHALFAFPWPRLRAAALALTLVGMAAGSIWVWQYVIALQAGAFLSS